MILVKTKIGQSNIHGIGLFAAEPIAKGTKVWEFTPGFEVVLDKEQVSRLSEAAREQFFHYAYLSKESRKYVLCTDDARFFNHDDNSNITCIVPRETRIENALECFATRDIQANEEITNNYREFDSTQEI
ncbi:MAG: SET domain-containing protein [bacterium]|nr:SET domain-containing protein [bacterium]